MIQWIVDCVAYPIQLFVYMLVQLPLLLIPIVGLLIAKLRLFKVVVILPKKVLLIPVEPGLVGDGFDPMYLDCWQQMHATVYPFTVELASGACSKG